MTIEQRAKSVTDEVGTATTGAELRALIAQALRDQIENCARVAKDREAEIGNMMQDYSPDTHVYNRSLIQIDECNLIEDRIRALAQEPKEEMK